jgi:DNA-binding transcriptional ArsR family regulator
MADFDHTLLDDVIHSRIRLAIMAVLVGVEHAEFTFLKDKVNATDGNLSVHLKRLDEAGYVSVHKRFVGRKPLSSYKLTARGRRAFESYVTRLESLINPQPSEENP